VVEARHVGHDGLLVRTGSAHDVCGGKRGGQGGEGGGAEWRLLNKSRRNRRKSCGSALHRLWASPARSEQTPQLEVHDGVLRCVYVCVCVCVCVEPGDNVTSSRQECVSSCVHSCVSVEAKIHSLSNVGV